MALNTLRCNHLTPLGLKGLRVIAAAGSYNSRVDSSKNTRFIEHDVTITKGTIAVKVSEMLSRLHKVDHSDSD